MAQNKPTPDELDALAERFRQLEHGTELLGGGNCYASPTDLRAARESVEREAARLRAEQARPEAADRLRRSAEGGK